MLRCGLLGEKLGHSYSPALHGMLGDYSYRLFEVPRAQLASFLTDGDWDGLNVTIPYKKAVLPFLAELSPEAAAAGSVNTLVRRDGRLWGYNTDVPGFRALLNRTGFPVTGKKVLVLGSGGASAAVQTVLMAMGANTVCISRSGAENYGNLERHRDAAMVVNGTPVGMYPGNGTAPLDLRRFPDCGAVIDLIYNPARTALLLQAEALGIPCCNGLYMLAAQAVCSAALFTGVPLPADAAERAFRRLRAEMQNIVLIGMPGCGKSTVAAEIAGLTGRRCCDADEELQKRTGLSPEQLILQRGEAAFRAAETAVLKDIGCGAGGVIATGGGAVTTPENYAALHQNGVIVWLQRPPEALPTDGRPLSRRESPAALLARREPLYRRFADVTLAVGPDSKKTAAAVLAAVESLWEDCN